MHVSAEMQMLEWGSGSSSQWFLMRVRSLISIEHDQAWLNKVQAHLNKLFTSDDLANRWSSHLQPATPEVVINAANATTNVTEQAASVKPLSTYERYKYVLPELTCDFMLHTVSGGNTQCLTLSRCPRRYCNCRLAQGLCGRNISSRRQNLRLHCSRRAS